MSRLYVISNEFPVQPFQVRGGLGVVARESALALVRAGVEVEVWCKERDARGYHESLPGLHVRPISQLLGRPLGVHELPGCEEAERVARALVERARSSRDVIGVQLHGEVWGACAPALRGAGVHCWVTMHSERGQEWLDYLLHGSGPLQRRYGVRDHPLKAPLKQLLSSIGAQRDPARARRWLVQLARLGVGRSMKLRYLLEAEERAVRCATAVVCVSESQCERMRAAHRMQEGDPRIVAIPNGLGSESFEWPTSEELQELRVEHGIGADDTVIVWVGRIVRQKGLEILIEALRHLALRRQLPRGCLLVVAGPPNRGAYVDRIQEEAESVPGLRVVFPGYVGGQRKRALFALASVFPLPSVHEPFGIALLEAMAMGAPVVAFDTDGPRTLVRPEFGRLAELAGEQGRIRRFAAAMLEVLHFRRAEASRAARSRAERYTWDRVTRQWLKLYGIREASSVL
ncbi:MAG: glycosyltransferase family 4 protein [Candidatus Krumholzibacteriia bacterium]